MPEGLDIGTLSGRIELEDRLTHVLSGTEALLVKFEDKFKETGQTVTKTAAGFFTAEAALSALKATGELAFGALEKLFDVTLQGSREADITQAFDGMTASAGRVAETLLGQLREGTRGTITDFDLMVRTNTNLAAGLNLTEAATKTLANGAFALAKATGIDTASAYDRLSDAMVTGRTRGIAMLTGKIDLAEAEERYAKSLGVTVEHLTEEGKMEATRQTILERVGSATERIGETQIRFADKIQQAKVSWEELQDDLGAAIATSPVIAAGMDGIGAALAGAFGRDRTTAIKLVATTVDDLAILLLSVGEVGTDVAGVLGFMFYKGKEGIDTFVLGLYSVEESLNTIAKAAYEVGDALALPGAAEGVERMTTNLALVQSEQAKWADAADANAKASVEWTLATGRFKDALEGVRQKMVDSKDATHDYANPMRDVAEVQETAAKATDAHAAATSKLGLTMARTKDEQKLYAAALKEMAESGTSYQEIVAKINLGTVESIKHYLDLGVAQDKLAIAYGLTAVQLRAIDEVRKDEIETMKAEQAVAVEISKLYIDYYTAKRQLVGTDTENIIAAAERSYQLHVAELQKRGVADREYYDELRDLRDKDIELADTERLLQDDRSLASLMKRLANARDYYQFMLAHGNQFRDADIANQAAEMQSLEEMRDHWSDVGRAVDANTEKVRAMRAEVQALTGDAGSYARQMANQGSVGGSWAVTRATMKISMEAAHTGVRMDLAEALAKLGYSYGEIIGFGELQESKEIRFASPSNYEKILKQMIAIGRLAPPQGPRIPGYAEGGVGDFGAGTLAMLHNKEAIIPLEKIENYTGGSITNHFYVNGTSADVARQISAEIMRTLKSRRQFSAA